MALEFRPPEELIRAYMERPSPGQIASQGVNQALQTYAQMKAQEQSKALQERMFASQEASRKASQFGAVAPYVPEAQIPNVASQYGITIPGAQPKVPSPVGTPAEQVAQQSLSSEHTPSSLIERWNTMQSVPAGGAQTTKPTSKFGREQYAKDLQIQKTEKDLAIDPNAPVPVISRDAALAAGQINPRAKILDDGSNQDLKTTRNSESNLRNQYLAQSKDFNEMTRGYQRVLDSSKDPSAAGDLAMLFGYMKMLDPGSVVRETEFANAENSAGVPERIRQAYNKAKSGERLTPGMRQDFATQAAALYKGQSSVQKRNREEFERIAASSGLDPKRVIVDTSIPESEMGGASSSGWSYVGQVGQ